MTTERPHGTDEAEQIRHQLKVLDQERHQLQARLDQIQSAKVLPLQPHAPQPIQQAVTNSSPAAEKVALFRRLFGGRTDVFPARWDNPNTGRSGYARAPIVARLRAA